jgi:murein L,D-transpeptidase YafK
MRPGALVLLVLLAAAGSATAWAHWPDEPLPAGAVADRVVVLKGARELRLERGGEALKTYRVALGRQPLGHKLQEGDGRTPEGVYRIESRSATSGYHRALRISYPDAADRALAASLGISPGGDVLVHGLPRGLGPVGRLHRLTDWTRGCIAVTNREIDEIWRAVPDGTPIEIRP